MVTRSRMRRASRGAMAGRIKSKDRYSIMDEFGSVWKAVMKSKKA